mgnify:CR=1 FL=1
MTLAFVLSGCTVPGDPNRPAKISDILIVVRNIIRLLAPVAGLAFFIMIIVGGYQFLTSGGDPKGVAQARSTLTYAIIGILLVVSAWLILVVIKEIAGVDVTTVKFPD